MTPSHLSSSLDALWIPLLIAIGILLFSVWRFGASASRIRRIRRAMDDLRARLVAQPSAEAPQILRACLRETQDPQLRFLLRETEAGMIALPATDGDVRHASLRSHAEQWTLRDVVGGRVNLALFETMPNLLIGFGLMCTFIFLAIALQQAGVALQALDATSRQQDQALQGLIATAGGKFITSIAGLFASLVWNWRAKVALESLQASLDEWCHHLRAVLPDNAAELSVRVQLSLFEALLQENREQARHLKNLEEALAQDVSAAMTRELQPAFDRLQGLASFQDATQGLGEMVQTLRGTLQELDQSSARAAQARLDEARQLGEASSGLGTGLGQLQGTLGHLQQAMGQIEQTATHFAQAAERIERAVGLQNTSAEQLAHGGQRLQEALETVRGQLQDAQQALTATVQSLTEGVGQYSTQVADLHVKMDQHLAQAVNQLGGSISNLEEVLDEFVDALPKRG